MALATAMGSHCRASGWAYHRTFFYRSFDVLVCLTRITRGNSRHREGQRTVKAYLKHHEKNGWTSRFDNLDPEIKAEFDIKRKDGTVIRTAEDRFKALETRLRTFEKITR